MSKWVYHPNGKVRAKGSYEPVIAEISTGCQRNEKIKFNEPRHDWNFITITRKEVGSGERLKALINCVTQEEDEFLDI